MELNLKQDKEKKLKIYKNDSRFKLIFQTLESYFKKKVDLSHIYFDSNIWFLSGDKILKKLMQNITRFSNCNSYKSDDNLNFNFDTPLPNCLMHEILFELNINKEDLKMIKIKYEDFFERIAQELLFCHELMERSQGLINQYKAHEMKNVIEQNKAKINKKNSDSLYKFNNNNYSRFFYILKNVTNFPTGKYTVETEFIELCDRESDRETAHTGKSVSGIFENKKNFFMDKSIVIDKEKAFVDLINKRDQECYKIRDYEIKSFNMDNNVKIPNISGTSLHRININFYKDNGDFLGDFTKNFIVLLLMNIEKIADIKHDDIIFSLISKIDTEDIINDYRIELEFFIKFDPQTRISVLENIYKILTNVIEMYTLYHNNIFEILSYFGEIRETIEFILNNPKNENKEICNSCDCNIL